MGAAIIAITCALMVIGVVIVSARSASQHREQTLARLAAALAGTADISAGTADGKHRGVAIAHRLTSRGAGSSAERWTEMACALPDDPLVLHIEPHVAGDEYRIAAGEMIDLEIGDPAFDRKLRVEAAPASVIKALFTPELRAFFVAHTVHLDSTARELQLSTRGWLEDPADATPFWDALVALQARLVAAAAEAARASAQVGGPFRAEPDHAAVRAAHASEVARVERVRTARAETQRQNAIVLVGLILAVTFVFVIFAVVVANR